MEGNASGEGRGGGTGGGLNGSAQQPPPFLSKTYDMVDNSTTDAVVSWGPENNSFVVWNPPEFARDLLPKYFKHSNFSSFVRQLNTYGFRKVDPDRWEFANEEFLRGKKNLLKGISRRKSSSVHSQPTQPQTQSTLLGACVEVGKFGLEEEIERLKRDKNVLMQELVRLRQQQQTTDNQLQTLGKRLQGMEQRQQQMMAFLAKAMQSPGFLAQFVQQNDSRHIASVNKKRRLPKKEDNIEGMRGSPDRQIIKYQPLVNEAANAMLMQILKMDASPTLDHANGSDAFLLDNSQSPSRAFESGSSSSLSSGLTLLEVPPSTGMPYLPTNSEFPAVSPEIVVSISDIQSVTGAVDMVSTAEMVTVPDTTALSAVPHSICQSQTDAVIPNLAPVHGVIPQSDIGVMLDSSPALPSTVGEIIDPLPVDMDGLAVLGLDTFSPEPNINILGEDSSLPGINDSFWEQFLTASPVEGEEEVDSGRQETDNGMQIEQDENLDQSQCMEYLTEQMELLSPKPKG